MSKIKEVLLLHHSHLDIGYTHPQPILWQLQQDYIDQAIRLCEETSGWDEQSKFRWTCEATAPLIKWLQNRSSNDVERLIRTVHSGQLGVAALPHHMTPLANSEQIIRGLYPVKWLRDQFGISIEVAINHDVNGQPWTFAQVLLDAGVRLYVVGINVHFGGFPLSRPMAFRWKVPDGRSLLTFNGEHYGFFVHLCKIWEKSTKRVAEGLEEYVKELEDRGYPLDFIYLTSTNTPIYDNCPPDRDLPHLIRRWNEEGHAIKIRFVTPSMLLERLETLPSSLIPEYSGDWTDYWNFGSGSSAVETRVARRSKAMLRTADFLCAFQPGFRRF